MLVSGGITMELRLAGAGAKFSMLPPGDGQWDCLNQIQLQAGLGSLKGTSLLGDVAFDSLLASSKLTMDGAAHMQGLLGEVSVSTAGKVKVKGLIITMKEALEEIIDIITEHTHPSGSGPTGPPMPPTPEVQSGAEQAAVTGTPPAAPTQTGTIKASIIKRVFNFFFKPSPLIF